MLKPPGKFTYKRLLSGKLLRVFPVVWCKAKTSNSLVGIFNSGHPPAKTKIFPKFIFAKRYSKHTPKSQAELKASKYKEEKDVTEAASTGSIYLILHYIVSFYSKKDFPLN